MKHPLLNEQELQEGLSELSGWSVEEGKWLVKKYRFPSFPEAIAFVNKVAGIAEKMNHHPFIAIDYRKVTLRITSWNSGGLTALDINSAKDYDQ
ncbi:4a-hydroxytetrahydrobiopterin dehydratase [Cohnella kolymensis]|uniref:4a-hydroxytetrahydrobiopterin dehydratase n=1 Tax=Cohnella kolymensis TaxID=1590652 RepID=UPI000A67643A|nr:4a-hydroxytetrahydrobiopterin dehydratase [Cohnella kolymensis]